MVFIRDGSTNPIPTPALAFKENSRMGSPPAASLQPSIQRLKIIKRKLIEK